MAAATRSAVKALDPDGRCEIDLAARRVKVQSAFAAERVEAAIAKAGFSPVRAGA